MNDSIHNQETNGTQCLYCNHQLYLSPDTDQTPVLRTFYRPRPQPDFSHWK